MHLVHFSAGQTLGITKNPSRRIINVIWMTKRTGLKYHKMLYVIYEWHLSWGFICFLVIHVRWGRWHFWNCMLVKFKLCNELLYLLSTVSQWQIYLFVSKLQQTLLLCVKINDAKLVYHDLSFELNAEKNYWIISLFST